MAKRSAKQIAATARLMAANAARRAGAIVVQAAAPVGSRRRRAASRIATVVAGSAGSRRRRIGARAVGAAGAMAIAQVRILPSAVGGYGIAKVERWQRNQHAKGIGSAAKKSGALIESPTTRLLAGLVGLAFVASRTQGMAKEAACGAAGGIGALYEIYSNTDGTNPDDSFLVKVAAGGDGI